MTRTAAAIIEVEQTIAELRDGRGPTRTQTVEILRRALNALWEQHCPCEKERCKYPLCHVNKHVP